MRKSHRMSSACTRMPRATLDFARSLGGVWVLEGLPSLLRLRSLTPHNFFNETQRFAEHVTTKEKFDVCTPFRKRLSGVLLKGGVRRAALTPASIFGARGHHDAMWESTRVRNRKFKTRNIRSNRPQWQELPPPPACSSRVASASNVALRTG